MNKRYILVDDVISFVENKTGLITLNKNAKPMIAVSDIEKIINKYNGKLYSSCVNMQNELKDLIPPKPELYGGLSVEVWRQLNEKRLFSLKVKIEGMGRYEPIQYLSDVDDYKQIIKLLPDPDNHIRHHNSNGINPLPNNVELEIHCQAVYPYKKLSQNIGWSYVFGYRILGIVNNDN